MAADFQQHEVAKLIGAPPGYLGHRETQPAFTQQKLNSGCSESCDISVVLASGGTAPLIVAKNALPPSPISGSN